MSSKEPWTPSQAPLTHLHPASEGGASSPAPLSQLQVEGFCIPQENHTRFQHAVSTVVSLLPSSDSYCKLTLSVVVQEAASGQSAVGQLRLSSETLSKLTLESNLATPEAKPAKALRGSMLLPKSKAESHASGSQKQHHQHSSETPQVQAWAPWDEGWDPSSSSSGAA